MWPTIHAIDGPPLRSCRLARSSVMSVSAIASMSSLNVSTFVSPCARSVAFIETSNLGSGVLRAGADRRYVRGGIDHPGTVRVVGDVGDSAAVDGDANEGARLCCHGRFQAKDNRRLAVDVAERCDHRDREARVAGEVRGLAQWALEPVGDAKCG